MSLSLILYTLLILATSLVPMDDAESWCRVSGRSRPGDTEPAARPHVLGFHQPAGPRDPHPVVDQDTGSFPLLCNGIGAVADSCLWQVCGFDVYTAELDRLSARTQPAGVSEETFRLDGTRRFLKTPCCLTSTRTTNMRRKSRYKTHMQNAFPHVQYAFHDAYLQSRDSRTNNNLPS